MRPGFHSENSVVVIEIDISISSSPSNRVDPCGWSIVLKILASVSTVM